MLLPGRAPTSSASESTSDFVDQFSFASTWRLNPSHGFTRSQLLFWSLAIIMMTPRVIFPLLVPSGIFFSLKRSIGTSVISLNELTQMSNLNEFFYFCPLMLGIPRSYAQICGATGIPLSTFKGVETMELRSSIFPIFVTSYVCVLVVSSFVFSVLSTVIFSDLAAIITQFFEVHEFFHSFPQFV